MRGVKAGLAVVARASATVAALQGVEVAATLEVVVLVVIMLPQVVADRIIQARIQAIPRALIPEKAMSRFLCCLFNCSQYFARASLLLLKRF